MLDFETMNGKEFLKNWCKLEVLLKNYKLELEVKPDNDNVKKKYEMLRLKMGCVENLIDGMPELQRNVVKDVCFNRMKWDVVCQRRWVSNNTINRYLKLAYDEVDNFFLDKLLEIE